MVLLRLVHNGPWGIIIAHPLISVSEVNSHCLSDWRAICCCLFNMVFKVIHLIPMFLSVPFSTIVAMDLLLLLSSTSAAVA